jgi:hypothetical protein
MTVRALRVVLLLLTLPAGDPAAAQQGGGGGPTRNAPPRWQLALAFVKRDSAALRGHLTSDVMIWPPAPDTARRGSAAIAYFLGLALSSEVSQSEFRPRAVTTDGLYLIEDGMWSFTHQRIKLWARYDLRWRQVNGRWKVSFLKWELFR